MSGRYKSGGAMLHVIAFIVRELVVPKSGNDADPFERERSKNGTFAVSFGFARLVVVMRPNAGWQRVVS